jgi:hypothetical protein
MKQRVNELQIKIDLQIVCFPKAFSYAMTPWGRTVVPLPQLLELPTERESPQQGPTEQLSQSVHAMPRPVDARYWHWSMNYEGLLALNLQQPRPQRQQPQPLLPG